MSGGGDDANRLAEEQIRLQQEELEQKRKAVMEQRMAIVKGQAAQPFTNPDNPNPPMQVIQ